MRLYTFVNYYLSPIQHGIQTAHVVSELSVKYYNPSSHHYMLYDWAKNHKTIIVLNGGNQANLQEILLFLSDPDNQYPYTHFCEDEQSLNNALTCVGIVIPEYVYEAASEIRSLNWDIDNVLTFEESTKLVNDKTGFNLTVFEYRLIQLLNSCKLA